MVSFLCETLRPHCLINNLAQIKMVPAQRGGTNKAELEDTKENLWEDF